MGEIRTVRDGKAKKGHVKVEPSKTKADGV